MKRRPIHTTTLADRQPRLHLVATLPIWASRALTPNEKILWYHMWLLDLGPEGTWIGTPALAQRLGLSERTVEDLRARLTWLGLLQGFARPGARNPGWVALLDADLVPRARTLREAGEEAPGRAMELDRRIIQLDAGPTAVRADEGPVLRRDPHHAESGRTTRSATDEGPVGGRIPSTGGGKGEGPTSQLLEKQLPPAVEDPEVGVGSIEPGEVGKKPARLTEMVADQMRSIARKRREA